jgi:hypothetical protein
MVVGVHIRGPATGSTVTLGECHASPGKTPPELLPIRPHCPDCEARMITSAVSDGPTGLEQRMFECAQCGHSETRTVVYDPLKSNAVGWIEGELRPPR